MLALQKKLKGILFSLFRDLVKRKNIPLFYIDIIVSNYSGGDEFESFLEFIKEVLNDKNRNFKKHSIQAQCPFIRTNIRTLSIFDKLVEKVINEEVYEDRLQAMKLIATICKPNELGYYLVQSKASEILNKLEHSNVISSLKFIFSMGKLSIHCSKDANS